MKKLSSLILSMALLLSLVPCIASAITFHPSNLTVIMEYGETPLGGIQIAICRVADVEEENGESVYQTVQAFAGAGADFSNLTKEKNITLAASLNTYASANQIARDIKATNNAGKSTFSNLPAGLYLVAQADRENSEYLIAPYLVSLPELREGNVLNYDVIAYPKTEPVKRDESQPPPPPPERIILSGYKLWYHRERDETEPIPVDQRPTSITLLVLADGEVILRRTITAADNWSWRIEVDKYAEDGHEIVYTVDEEIIYDYRKWVVKRDGNDVIINEYSPGDDTEDIPDDDPPLYAPDDGPDGPNAVPTTNDNANLQLWLVLMGAGSVGLIAAVLFLLNTKRQGRIKRKG